MPTLGSENRFPLVRLLTDDPPSAAPAGQVHLYADTDKLAYQIDEDGTITALAGGGGGGDVATDAIWDAAGDLAVGSGSDTAARLAMGAEGSALTVMDGVVGWNGATSMPGSPTTGQRVWRSDLALECYYDGTRWLSTTLYTLPLTLPDAATPQTANGSIRAPFPHPTLDIRVLTFWGHFYVTSNNTGGNYWTATLVPDTSIVLSTNGNSSGVGVLESSAVNYNLAISTGNGWIECLLQKTGTPGSIYAPTAISYRLIVT